MDTILTVFTDNILPIFIVAGFGVALRLIWRVDPKPLSHAVFYVLSPCLLFSSLVNSPMSAAQLASLAAFAFANVIVMGMIGYGVGRLLRLPKEAIIIVVMAAMFSNNGNYGLSLNQLRHGDIGLTTAIPYFVISAGLMYTVGVIITSSGKQPWPVALAGLLKLPIFYALLAAVLVFFTGYEIPAALNNGITITGNGAIPLMLVILGMQMADIRRFDEINVALPAVIVRVLIGPLVALGIATALGLDGLNRSVSITQAALPVAVSTIIITTQFDVMPKAMTTTVVLSTLLSPVLMTAVIQLMAL